MHQPTMHTRSKAKPAKSAFNAALDQEDHGIQENIPVSAKPKPKPRAPKKNKSIQLAEAAPTEPSLSNTLAQPPASPTIQQTQSENPNWVFHDKPCAPVPQIIDIHEAQGLRPMDETLLHDLESIEFTNLETVQN